TRSDRDWSSDVCSSDLKCNGRVAPADSSAGGRIRITETRVGQRAGRAEIQQEAGLIGERADKVFEAAFRIEAHGSAGEAESSFRSEERRVGKESGTRGW